MTIPDAGFLMENGDSCLPVPPDEERRMVVELYQAAEANLKEGNVYYVLSSKWWLLWRKYAGLDDRYRPIVEHSAQSQSTNGFLMIRSRPGPIDNSNLVLNGRDGGDEEPELRSGLLEGNDYVLVAQEIWKKLVEWYKGGPALPRKMISQGSHLNSLVVELYPLRLHLIDSNSAKDVVIRISKKASIRKLFDRVCILLKLDPKKVHIWDFFNKRKCKELTTFDQSLEEAQLQMDQHILVESDTDGSWHFGSGMDSTGNGLALVPVEPSRSPVSIAGGPSLSNGYTSTGNGRDLMQGSVSSSGLQDSEFGYDLLSSSSTKGDGIGGLTGLQNLGNTCFMNSALQCLSHTPPLVEYFLQDYGDEINTENPLGLKGELAVAFGELLRKLWSSGRMPVAPRAFKTKLARFAPQFSGYNQHDSQELLAFLLDGLHEDLNRVKSKPYIETKDANGRPDEEFADECWANHKARNDSIIVDVCQGQYKSTLVCPVCSKVSVTFDPFMYLSLPLPSTVTRSMTLTVLYGDGRGLPMPYTVNVLKCGTCKDLTHALSMACCLESGESLLIAEVYEHKIFRYLEDPSESLSEIKDDEHFVAYRLPANQRTLTRLEILHTQKQSRYTTSQNGIGPQEFFGTPLVTCLPVGSLTSFNIQAAVCSILAPLLRVKINKENSCNGQSELGIDRVMDNRDACSSPLNDQLTLHCDMELDARSGWSSSLQLWVTDERYHNLTSIESFSFTRAGQPIRLVMDWSQKEHELYNASYLKDLPEVFKSGFTAKKTRQESISLFSCLEAFLKEEPLGPDDMWYCPSCKEHRQATKKLDLWRLPDILVFHLKRFSYSRYLKNKLETFVNFPIRNLDLSKYVKHKESSPQSHIYELYAVSNHYGGLGGGHYTAHAKLLEENRWFHFDDSHVSSASDDSVRTPAAYVLFYRRVRADSVMQEAGESSSKI